MSETAITLAGEPREQAIRRLVDAYGGSMYQLGRRLCNRHEDAEDLVQETFLQAYRNWHAFEGRSSPKTWLFTIAARLCGRMHRRRVGEPARLDDML